MGNYAHVAQDVFEHVGLGAKLEAEAALAQYPRGQCAELHADVNVDALRFAGDELCFERVKQRDRAPC